MFDFILISLFSRPLSETIKTAPGQKKKKKKTQPPAIFSHNKMWDASQLLECC